jgi:hypothetical protein
VDRATRIRWSPPQGADDWRNIFYGFLIERAVAEKWERIADLPREAALYTIAPSSISPTNFYRVCTWNERARTCSEPVEAKRIPIYQERQVDVGLAAGRNFGPPSIQRVAPASYTKMIAQAPEHLQVQLTFEGSPPSRARYSIDEGLSMACGPATAGAKLRCWIDAAQLNVVNNTATVLVPYSAVQQAKRQVHIELSNHLGASRGTIQISPAVAGIPPTVKRDLGAPQAPAPSRESPGASDAAPKGAPPPQRLAPGKGTESLFPK